ncbi:MAG: hypothetical protein QOG64_2645, partial [Acidimicrobiaceae bacterium]|nr:hypothetical protein [Acidimicrobiaceae bacterium]
MIRERLERVTGGELAFPLAVLAGIHLVDEFDRIAFASLTPEIRDAFHLSDSGIIFINVIAALLVLFAALPMGILADRFSRVRMALIGGIVWATMSVATGLVPIVALLFVVRLFAGVGRSTNEIVHPSLLQDYYSAENQPQVFMVHRLATPLSALSALVAGGIAATLGWRWAFVLLSIPGIVLLTGISRLREPKRGQSIDAALASEVEEVEAPVPFAEARRQLFAVKTLRRLYFGSFLLGIGLISIGSLLSLFFEKVYGFGPVARGGVQVVFGAGTVIGLIIGGRVANQQMKRGAVSSLATIAGASFIVGAIGCVLMAIAPVAALSLAFATVVAAGFGGFYPAYYPLVGLVAPPRVRAQAFAYSILFVGFGGVISSTLGGIGDSHGYRVALIVLAGVVALAGVVGASASRFVPRDVEQAMNSLTAARDMREELARTGERALLMCRRVEVAYDQVQVLFGVDMEVRPGEIVALLGTNGAGKSTLLKAISGTVDPIGGAIFFDGRDITHADPNQTVAHGIVQVPGGKAVFPTLTVAEHLRAAGWLYRKDPDYLKQATEEVYVTFPRLRERLDQMAGNLSGGEQQMLALGMAFIAKPKLLMIDELSLGLAPTIVEQLLVIVRRIQESGTAIVLVEQSINVALTVAQRAYFLEKGEVRFQGPTQELVERDDIVRSVFLKGASSVDGRANGKKAPRVERVRPVDRKEPVADGAPILEVDELVKRFGGIRAVDAATFLLREGEILGLIGPNGAGKTTIFDIISGLLPIDTGRLSFLGADITSLGPDKRAGLGLGRSFQDARIFPTLTV